MNSLARAKLQNPRKGRLTAEQSTRQISDVRPLYSVQLQLMKEWILASKSDKLLAAVMVWVRSHLLYLEIARRTPSGRTRSHISATLRPGFAHCRSSA